MCDTPDSQAPEQQQRVKKLDKLVNRLTSTYYILKKVDKSTAGARVANEQKTLARRKLIRRRRSTTTGHLTDASESSFDSSLIDCFKGLATLNDVDPNHHPHVNTTSKRRRGTSQSWSNAQRYFFKRTTTAGHNCHPPAIRHNRSTVKRLQHTAHNKHTNSHHNHQTTNMVDMSDLCMNGSCGVATTSKNIELFLNESQGCTVKRKKMHMQRHDHDRAKRMDIDKPVNSSSYMSDVNDQSSVNDDETDVDVEADDEQSDWPVNEPSLKQASSKTMSIDDTDECSDYDTRRLLTNNNDDSFACPNFPGSLKNIMVSSMKSNYENRIQLFHGTY